MGRPRLEDRPVATPQRLLEAAEEAFGRHGFEGAKLAAIAARAGISRPSLLYHYGSKHALYGAVVRTVFDDLSAALSAALTKEQGFAERLEEVMAAFVTFVKSRPDAARLILREVMDDEGPGHDLILEAGVPVLEMVERFVRIEGHSVIRPDLPIRSALLQLVSSTFVKAASGSLERALWGDRDDAVDLARVLFIGGPTT